MKRPSSLFMTRSFQVLLSVHEMHLSLSCGDGTLMSRIFLKNPDLPAAVLNCMTPMVDGSVKVKTLSTYFDSPFVVSMLLVNVVIVDSSDASAKPCRII